MGELLNERTNPLGGGRQQDGDAGEAKTSVASERPKERRVQTA